MTNRIPRISDYKISEYAEITATSEFKDEESTVSLTNSKTGKILVEGTDYTKTYSDYNYTFTGLSSYYDSFTVSVADIFPDIKEFGSNIYIEVSNDYFWTLGMIPEVYVVDTKDNYKVLKENVDYSIVISEDKDVITIAPMGEYLGRSKTITSKKIEIPEEIVQAKQTSYGYFIIPVGQQITSSTPSNYSGLFDGAYGGLTVNDTSIAECIAQTAGSAEFKATFLGVSPGTTRTDGDYTVTYNVYNAAAKELWPYANERKLNFTINVVANLGDCTLNYPTEECSAIESISFNGKKYTKGYEILSVWNENNLRTNFILGENTLFTGSIGVNYTGTENDINRDGYINTDDIEFLTERVSDYTKNHLNHFQCDINKDGVVNKTDLELYCEKVGASVPSAPENPIVTTTATTTTKVATTTKAATTTKTVTTSSTPTSTDVINLGDTNLDGKDGQLSDVISLGKYLGKKADFTEQQKLNANCHSDVGLTSNDLITLVKVSFGEVNIADLPL